MKDKERIYELINEMDFNIEDYEKEELSDIEKRKLKNNFKKSNKKENKLKNFTKVAAILIILAGIFSQTSTGKNVYALAQSKVLDLSYSLGQTLYIERDIEDYSNVINKIYENNGVGIKLTSLILDKDELIFSTLIYTEKPADYIDYDYDIWLNGKKLKRYGASGSSGSINDSKNEFFATYLVDVKNINLKDKMDIKIIVKNFEHGIFDGDNLDKVKEKGTWEFNFIASGEKLQENTYTKKLNYTFNIDNKTYKLEEFRYNPVSQKIYGKIIDNNKKDDYIIDLKGYDNLGNKVEFGFSRQRTNELIFRYENINGDLSEKASSISLSPYAAKIPKESGRMPKADKKVGESFTINLK
ncbi:MAG: DUF4179 domain-containing protein [Peptoniphilaceae bacterium]